MSQSGEPPPDSGDQPPGEDPFERLVLNEDFIKSASISEISARARQRRNRVPWRRRWWNRIKGPFRRRRSGGGGQPRRRRSPHWVPDWTPAQWVVTSLAVVAVVAYLYFSLGGRT